MRRWMRLQDGSRRSICASSFPRPEALAFVLPISYDDSSEGVQIAIVFAFLITTELKGFA